MKLASIHFDKPVNMLGVYANASMTINGRMGETITRDGDTVKIAHAKLAAPGYILVPWHRVLQCVPLVEPERERLKPGPKPKSELIVSPATSESDDHRP